MEKQKRIYYTFNWTPYHIQWKWQNNSKLIFGIREDTWNPYIKDALDMLYWHKIWNDIYEKVMTAFENVNNMCSKNWKFKPWVFKLIVKAKKLQPVESFRFFYDEKNSYYWKWDNGNILRFWWKPNFIIESLKDLYWDETKEIFIKFMNAMNKTNEILDKWNIKEGVFYLTNRRYYANKRQQTTLQDIQSWEKKLERTAEKNKKNNME